MHQAINGMSYKYAAEAKTTKGKIIYPRKKHTFSVKDARRINRTYESPRSNEDKWIEVRMVAELIDRLVFTALDDYSDTIFEFQILLRELEKDYEDHGFGDGNWYA